MSGDSLLIWQPDLVASFASYLSPNEIACTLRLVNKATAAQFNAVKHITILLSLPVPHDAFVRRWGHTPALRPLTWRQRRQLLQLTARSGSIANLEVLLAFKDHFPPRSDVLEAAAGAGQLAICQELRARRCPWSDGVLDAAAAGGHRDMCVWLLASGCSWSVSAPAQAARGGHVALLDWLLAAVPLSALAVLDMLVGVAYGCDLATLTRLYGKFVQDEDADEQYIDWRLDILSAALAGPTPDWWAKAEWAVPAAAVTDGVLRARGLWSDMLQRDDWEARLEWVRRRCGPAEHTELVVMAIGEGHLAAARSLLAEGRPRPLRIRCSMHLAAEKGASHLPVLQLLVASGYPLRVDALAAALESGDMVTVGWVAEQLGLSGGPGGGEEEGQQQRQAPGLPASLFEYAARSGKVEVLEWLLARGCPWDADVFAAAAVAGSEEALEWLAERGCPMGSDGDPYVGAAARDDVAVLRCLQLLGCPWSRSGGTFTRAALLTDDDHIDLACHRPVGLVWLLEHGCPVDWQKVGELLGGRVVEWLREVERERRGGGRDRDRAAAARAWRQAAVEALDMCLVYGAVFAVPVLAARSPGLVVLVGALLAGVRCVAREW